ncbi:hypothetical protein [Actinacidiphila sp. DG2A-62]
MLPPPVVPPLPPDEPSQPPWSDHTSAAPGVSPCVHHLASQLWLL